jgi:hypothetical protein
MNSEQILRLEFSYWSGIVREYLSEGGKGLGPDDEYIGMYCMGGEL